MLAIWGVMRFYHLLKSGMSWKGPEAIELWYLPILMADASDGPPAEDESLLVGYDSSSELSFPESHREWNAGKICWKNLEKVNKSSCSVGYFDGWRYIFLVLLNILRNKISKRCLNDISYLLKKIILIKV